MAARTHPAAATAPPTPAPRRRPRQQRAQHTARALREAFVQLWAERGYDAITIREIVMVAGTGLGSFYEYFASKEDLARVCLHLRSKALLLAMRAAVAATQGQPLAQVVEAIVASQVAPHREQPREWAEHYMLERRLSGPEAYRKMFDRFVAEWVAALAAAPDVPATCNRRETARVCQTILYGLTAHSCIRSGERLDAAALTRQTRTALVAYVRAAGAAQGAGGIAPPS